MDRSSGKRLRLMRFFAFGMFMLLMPSGLYADDQASAAGGTKMLQHRIDFGNAQILGQSIKSGAVYLMHRKKSDIKNMLEVRQDYRDEIKEDYDLDKTAISEGKTPISEGVAEPQKDSEK